MKKTPKVFIRSVFAAAGRANTKTPNRADQAVVRNELTTNMRLLVIGSVNIKGLVDYSVEDGLIFMVGRDRCLHRRV